MTEPLRPHAGRPTRRSVLASLLGLSAGAGASLTGCAPPLPPGVAQGRNSSASGSGTPGAPSVSLAADRSGTDKLVRFSNWTEYVDRSDDNRSFPTIKAFTAKTGIAVDYTEDIDDNDTYWGKLDALWLAGKDVGTDLLVFSDWMVNRIIRQGLAAPLDSAVMTHAKNVLPALKNVSFDPGRHYSLPWQSGFAGIAYNKKKLGREIRTVDELWAPDLKGKVTLLSEMRDTIGLIMQAQGVDVSGEFSRAQIEAGFDVVRKRIADGSVRRVKGNSYTEDFKAGNALAGFAWSGDIFALQNELGNTDWQFVMPESCGILWSDTALIPSVSPHRTAAMRLLDYYYEPAVAAKVAAWVNYICPVQGAQAELAKTDEELAQSPFIFPTARYLRERTREFRALTPDEDQEYSALWAKVVGN